MTKTWHGFIFRSIEKFWQNLRFFAFTNRTIFELMFILLYAIEQAFLVYFTFTIDSLNVLLFVVSIFVIIVLTTFALHRQVMESRIKFLEEMLSDVDSEKQQMERKHRAVLTRYNDLTGLYEELSKDLNRKKSKKY